MGWLAVTDTAADIRCVSLESRSDRLAATRSYCPAIRELRRADAPSESKRCSSLTDYRLHLRAPFRAGAGATAAGAACLAGSTKRINKCLLLSIPATGDMTMRAN